MHWIAFAFCSFEVRIIFLRDLLPHTLKSPVDLSYLMHPSGRIDESMAFPRNLVWKWVKRLGRNLNAAFWFQSPMTVTLSPPFPNYTVGNVKHLPFQSASWFYPIVQLIFSSQCYLVQNDSFISYRYYLFI